MSYYDKFKVDVPEGESGHWRVERFNISAQAAILFSLNPNRRAVAPGNYTRLMCGGTVVMSDTPAEIQDHLEFIRMARGRVLIHGLGLGMCLQAVLDKDEVEHALVIEKSPDVIALVAQHYRDKYPADRLEIREGDAFTWKPEKGRCWDYAWHDVWNHMCEDDLPQMHKLHRRFGRRCYWQGSWGRKEIERRRRERKRERRHNPWAW
jgi:hypothetical protein